MRKNEKEKGKTRRTNREKEQRKKLAIRKRRLGRGGRKTKGRDRRITKSSGPSEFRLEAEDLHLTTRRGRLLKRGNEASGGAEAQILELSVNVSSFTTRGKVRGGEGASLVINIGDKDK